MGFEHIHISKMHRSKIVAKNEEGMAKRTHLRCAGLINADVFVFPFYFRSWEPLNGMNEEWKTQNCR